MVLYGSCLEGVTPGIAPKSRCQSQAHRAGCVHYVMSVWPTRTIVKIKFAFLRMVGIGGREENRPRTLFFLGNAMTI